MQYMLAIYTDPSASEQMSAKDVDDMHREYMAFSQELVAAGAMVSGDALQGADTATTVRVCNGSTTTTDGPFAETKEVLGGYYIVECDDLDRAIEWAAKIPDARRSGVEVRPVRSIAAEIDART